MRPSLAELRFGARALRRAPVAAVFVVATLALCIGASTGVFSIVHGVLLRGLPYRDPGRLVWISSVRPGRDDAPFSLPEFMDLRERARTVDLAAYTSWSATLPTTSGAQRLQGMRISGHGFDLLGPRPSAGRLLRAADDAADADRVVVLSHAFWQRHYGGSNTALGARLSLDGDSYTVVGVLPRLFPLPLRDLDVVTALSPDGDPRRHARSSVNFLRVVGRLRGAATREATERELTALTAELRARFPTEYATKLGVRVRPMQQYLVGDSRQTLLVLVSCVGLMLAVALANVLNLLLIRSTERQGEIAVRRALGASARHVASLLLAEGALLAAAGAVAGTVVAHVGVALVTRNGPQSIPRLDEVRVDGTVLLFVVGLLSLATAVFSLAPLASALSVSPEAALRATGRTGAGRPGQNRLRGVFLVSQIALAVVLTATTATLLQSLARLQRIDFGYRPDSVFVARLSLPPRRYSRPTDLAGFEDRLQAALEQQPGVIAAGIVSIAPLSGLLSSVPFAVPSRPPLAYRERPSANFRAISPGYFAAIRAPIVAGRGFTEADDASAPPVAIVSRALAERYFGSSDPLGQTLLVDDNDVGPRPITVVGVVRNLRHVDLEGPPTYDVYIPVDQIHRDGVLLVAGNQFWLVRLTIRPSTFAPAFLRTLRAIDPDAATATLGSMTAYVDAVLATRRFAVTLLLSISLIALSLAAVGVYGVMAYFVAQRRREIGVRLALGTPPRQVVALVLSRALGLSALGIALGIGGSLIAGRAVAGLVFGIVPNDAWTLTGVSLLIGAVSLVASWVPARRAARIDPLLALSAG